MVRTRWSRRRSGVCVPFKFRPIPRSLGGSSKSGFLTVCRTSGTCSPPIRRRATTRWNPLFRITLPLTANAFTIGGPVPDERDYQVELSVVDQRYQAGSSLLRRPGLVERFHRPARCSHQMDPAVEVRILEARRCNAH
jgi:hypothetical protein